LLEEKEKVIAEMV